MPRKRGLYGTSPPSANDRYAMDWDTALQGFHKKHGMDMGQRHHEAMYGYPFFGFSVSGLWSYRGYIWKKYEGKYPTPEEVGLPADHDFFNPDVIDYSESVNAYGEVVNQEWRHHGLLMKPTHRLWPKAQSKRLKMPT